jgi:hypothetical protein
VTFNDTAAAYGLFQIAYSDLADHLAVAVFRLRQCKEAGLDFNAVFKQDFGRTLKELKRELCQFENYSETAATLDAIRRTCEQIKDLTKWRNDDCDA